jgi:dephospho-CoA kinase
VVIGVTGGVGTGKSTVAAMFNRLGATVLDADAMAHALMEPKRPAWRRIVQAFGRKVVNPDETINRTHLAALVFQDARQRARLERILHPQVMGAITRELRRLKRGRGVPVVVLDIPLLVEVGAQKLVDVLVVVTASPSACEERLARRAGWTREEIARRIKAQWDLSAKVALADHVVDNSGGVKATRTQVKRIWRTVVQSSRRSSTSRP